MHIVDTGSLGNGTFLEFSYFFFIFTKKSIGHQYPVYDDGHYSDGRFVGIFSSSFDEETPPNDDQPLPDTLVGNVKEFQFETAEGIHSNCCLRRVILY